MPLQPSLRLAAAVALALINFSDPVAADEQRYPAALCQQHAGPGAFLYFSSLVAPPLPNKSLPQHNGGVCPPPQAGGCPPCATLAACRNDPAFMAKVDCPILKAFPDNGIEDVTVDVIDRHGGLNVQCFLTSAVWNATINDFEQSNQPLSSSGTGNHIQPLKFAPMNAPKPAAHWYISCAIPANSAIVSYFVDEK